jgi:DNA repair exonuclease SbcCD nuclease subunit
MPVKILATGDIHIGKKSSGLPAETEEIATKHTWMRLVDLAINNQFDALLLTGDIVDRDNRYFEAIGPLQTGFNKLKTAEIAVFIIAGNHDFDVLKQVVNTSEYDNIHVLGAKGNWEVKSFTANEEEVRFVGWSFPKRYMHTDPLEQLEINGSDLPTIGLLHAELDTPDSRYAPVKTENLLSHPVDAWILGHIHKPSAIPEHRPFVLYPGSPHALSAKEQGKHGPLQITVESKNDIRIEQIPLSPVRYETLSIDISNARDEEILRKLVMDNINRCKEQNKTELAEVRHLVFDIILYGEHPASNDIEKWMATIRDDFYWSEDELNLSVRKVEFDIRPAVENMEELAKESSPAGLLAETIVAIQNGQSTPLLNELLKKWKADAERINNSPVYQNLRWDDRTINVDDQTGKKEILNQCKRLLGELLNQKA